MIDQGKGQEKAMLRSISIIPGRFWAGSGRAVGLALLFALVLTSLGGEEKSEANSPRREMPEPVVRTQFQIGAPAVDFDKGLDWLNTEKPLSLADLRGRVVLLDFWTLC
jgi:hypothetical protein